MKKKMSIGIFLLALIVGSYWSCKKSSTQQPDTTSVTSIVDNAQADEAFNDIFLNVNAITQANPNLFSSNSSAITAAASAAGGTASTLSVGDSSPETRNPCAIVSVSPTTGAWPRTITFDYRTGCTNNNAVTQKGQLIAQFSGPLLVSGSALTITFNNYVVNNTAIGGTNVVTNNGINTAGNYTFTHVVANARLVNRSLRLNMAWNSTKVYEWIAGVSSSYVDNQFSITGSATGINSSGSVFTATITKPLIKKAICPFISSGTVQIIESATNSIKLLVYGNGACNPKATVTIDGRSQSIVLRK